MSNLITVKIDVTKIDKARLFNADSGAKYLDLVCIPTPNGKFGATHIVTQSVSKEERESGVKMPIIGNATERGPKGRHTYEPGWKRDESAGERPPRQRDSIQAPKQQDKTPIDENAPF